MSRIRVYEKVEHDHKDINTANWPIILVDNLSDKHKEIYNRRKKAVDMYLSDKPIELITKETNFHRNIARKLALRCLEVDDNGEIYGYRALIPYKRINKYNRKDESTNNYSGVFTNFIEKYPEIKQFLEQEYLGNNKKKSLEKNIKPSSLHKKFILKCHKLKIQEHEYPFNTSDKGRRSLYRYLESLKSSHYHKYSSRFGDATTQKLKSVGIGSQNNPIISRPFQQVQFDGHKIDTSICIKFRTPEGDIVKKTMSRIWLLAIIDVSTRAIIGYHLCLNSEYSSADVLKCIENSIIPKKKMNFSIPRLTYPENGGFPSLCIPETKWALWDEFLYDNAKANLAKVVTENLTRVVKCNINAGPVATPERRGIVERFFRTLEERGFHRLTSTVGSGINDPRRKNSDINAIKYEVSEAEIEEITEILIANYNNTPHSGINGFSPLDLMKQRIERGYIPKIMPVEERNDISLLQLKTTRVVRGNIKTGRRPYINYEGVEYRNDVLSKSPDLIGKKLTLLVNINDIRIIKAYLSDGSEFGLLTANGKWGVKPHTLKMRKEINFLKNNKDIDFNIYDDPIDIYHEHLSSKAVDNKSSRNKLATLNKIQNQNINNLKENSMKTKKQTNISKNNSTNQLIKSDIDKVDNIKNNNMFKTLTF